jgi:hypothetical protein
LDAALFEGAARGAVEDAMKSMRIGARLGGSYGLLCALVVFVGAFGLSEISALNESVADIAVQRWEKAHSAMEGLGIAGEQTVAVNALFLATDAADVQQQLARIETIRDKAAALVKTREGTLKSGRGKQLFEELDASRAR